MPALRPRGARCRGVSLALVSAALLLQRAAYPDLPVFEPLDDGSSKPPPLRPVGLMFDVGSSDGGMMSLVVRPRTWLRAHAGGGSNGMAPGIRTGIVVLPWGPGPALALEAGHYFEGNLNGLMQMLIGPSYRSVENLEHFDYDFVNLHAGMEVERAGVMFFAHGGLTYLWTRLDARETAFLQARPTPSGPLQVQGNVAWVLMPSLKIGFVGFL